MNFPGSLATRRTFNKPIGIASSLPSSLQLAPSKLLKALRLAKRFLAVQSAPGASCHKGPCADTATTSLVPAHGLHRDAFLSAHVVREQAVVQRQSASPRHFGAV